MRYAAVPRPARRKSIGHRSAREAKRTKGRSYTTKRPGFYSGLSDTLYKENSKSFCFRCGAADTRLSATHGLTTAFLHLNTSSPYQIHCPQLVTSTWGHAPKPVKPHWLGPSLCLYLVTR